MDKDFAGEAAPITKAPAIGMSVTVATGPDRQFVLQTFVDQEAGEKAANDLADRLMRVADRQQAIYKIPLLIEEIEKVKRTLEMFEANMANVIALHAKQIATFDVQLEELQGRRDEERQAGYDEHVARGGRGEYAPKGHRLSTINAVEAQIEKVKAERQKLVDEDAENFKNIDKTRAVENGQIAKLQKQIEECRAKIG